jgi:transposase-like protein
MILEEKYPRDFQEFLVQFKDEESCWLYIFELRYPNGYICEKCEGVNYWVTKRRLLCCSTCGHQSSLIQGTLFEKTRKPLLLWFHIMWWVVAQKTGTSASNLKDFMGFGSYETAWVWLQKLRRAMVRPHRELLSGVIEVDETYIGGIESDSNNRGRGAETKTLVVVATECIGKQIGRVRFMVIPDASTESLKPFVEQNISKGSTVITDGWTGYTFLTNDENFIHEAKPISGSGSKAHELLPHVHLVDSLLKRWLNGTHQGKVSPKYLPYYLDEFSFRFNRKLSTYRGKLFYRLMQQALTTPPAGLDEIKHNLT